MTTGWTDYPPNDGQEHTVTGRMKTLTDVWSPQLENRRDLLVHLPPSYDSGTRRYPVLYMQDGQNLFDRATSYADEWNVDGSMQGAARPAHEAIIVGIPNLPGRRIDEYSPFMDRKLGGGRGDRYLEFVLDTVKPLVDAEFRTMPGRAGTGIFGSSMGGLISLYGFFCHPEAFGMAGAMSPALWFAERALFPWLALAPFVPGRLYLDVGTLEGGAELVDVTHLREALVAKGYRTGRDLLCLVEKGGRHDEQAWGRRFPAALRFLLARSRTRIA